MKLKIYQPEPHQESPLPLVLSPVQAGFPSPAEDHVEHTLDLNTFLIKHPAATFFVKVQGDSMQNAGISEGDILIVDRALAPSNGKIVVAIVNGEFTVKRIRIENKQLFLLPENPKYRPIPVHQEMDFEVWGVVSYIIHKAK